LERLIDRQQLDQLSGTEITKYESIEVPTTCQEPGQGFRHGQSHDYLRKRLSDDAANTVMRNRYEENELGYCFSIVSSPTCVPGFLETETDTQSVPFHCFKEEDKPYVDQLLAEIDSRPLDQLNGQSVTYTKTKSYPTACSESTDASSGRQYDYSKARGFFAGKRI